MSVYGPQMVIKTYKKKVLEIKDLENPINSCMNVFNFVLIVHYLNKKLVNLSAIKSVSFFLSPKFCK